MIYIILFYEYLKQVFCFHHWEWTHYTNEKTGILKITKYIRFYKCCKCGKVKQNEVL